MIDKEVARTFDRRSALFLTAGAILTSALVLRMLQMQLFNYREYTKKSENNSFRIQINMPERGKILSASGSPISRDVKTYRIYIVPEETTDIDNVISVVANELKLNKKRINRIYAKIKKQARFQPVLISENSNWSDLAALQAKNIPGLHVRSGFARVYEMGPAGAQIFGYVGDPPKPVENAPFFTTGITGLEKRFNDELAGIPGQTVMITNAVGRVTGEDKSQFKPAIVGTDVRTTINDAAQRTMYDALMQNRAGCGVALDIDTGDILAMVSTPSFDANMFTTDDADEYITSLRNDYMKPFMNKTIEGLYPPGSTFKIVVALAALESGAITPNEKIFCPGHWDYGDRRYHCWETKGHGWVTLADALKHSCDIYFYQQKLNERVNKLLDKKFEKFNKIVSRHINTNASDVAQKMAENLRNNTNENWTVIEYGPKDNYFSFQLRNNTKPNKSFFIQNSPVWYLGRTRIEGTGQLPDEKVLSVPYDEFGEKMYQLAWITCALDRAPASKSREYCARLRCRMPSYCALPLP